MNVPTSIYVEQGIRVKSWAGIGAAVPLLISCYCLAMAPKPAHAEEGVFDAWARWVVHRGPWKGPTVPFPDTALRPDGPWLSAHSVHESLHVHAPPSTTPTHLAKALVAAEEALGQLRAAGWAVPGPDGGLGGTPGFDVYLIPSEPGASAGLDAPDALSLYDGAVTFARVGSTLPPHLLSACMTSAVTQAALLAHDPAEAEALRTATGGFAAWRFAGQPGCTERFDSAQQTPERGVIGHGSGEAGGLFLAMLSERTDGGSGRFVRDMWQFARQRSDDPTHLRAAPDLWQAIARALHNARDALDDVLIEFAIARVLEGRARSGERAGFAILNALSGVVSVPIRTQTSYAELPRHLYSARGVHALGTAYTRITLDAAEPHPYLHVWLRGELGPRWSLAAVQRDARGRELTRLVAPARRTPKSYLPVMLAPNAAEVVLVVTHLPAALPDADSPAPAPAHYKLIVSQTAGD
ncbi:MAG: hypothetical protein OXR73_13955 [Myxococcales bacterium]|nr:hypothetical protein [Myxococcales bacterium]